MSTATQTPRPAKRTQPLPEPFRQSVETPGWRLDPWVLLPIPFIAGGLFSWDLFPLFLVPTLIAYVALEALRGRRRASKTHEDRGDSSAVA